MPVPMSERTTPHRYAQLAGYGRDTIDATLDEGW